MTAEIPQNGSCAQMPAEMVDEYFFPKQYNPHLATIKMAKRICAGCVEQDSCRIYAMETLPPFGVMAAMSPDDRYRLAAREGGDAS